MTVNIKNTIEKLERYAESLYNTHDFEGTRVARITIQILKSDVIPIEDQIQYLTWYRSDLVERKEAEARVLHYTIEWLKEELEDPVAISRHEHRDEVCGDD